MNHEYEDELGINTERRSRRNPRQKAGAEVPGTNPGDGERTPQQERAVWESRQRDAALRAEKELDIMGDATVHPLKQEIPKTPAAEPLPVSPRQSSVDGKGTAARVAAVAKAHGVSGKAAEARAARAARADSKEVKTADVAGVSNGSSPSGGGSQVRRRLEEEAARRKKRRRIITMIIAECIALIFIFGYAYVARQLSKLQRPDDFKISELQTNELNVDTVETMKGYWTIAVFGVDSRDNAINKSTHADVNIICNVNRDTGEIKLVSVFRDTYLNLTEGGTYNKLNQAYFTGGPEQAIQVLNRNLDLHINDYMTFNWKAVADAINVLGGVDIELSDAEFYYINGFITETVEATGIGSHHLKHAGMNHLDGVQAVAYARLRLMDTDYARTERQRKVIAKAFEKAKQADFKTLNTLIGTVFPQVSTSIWVDDLVGNAKNINKFHIGDTMGFPQARGDANMGKKGAVVVPQTLESNVIKLHEFLFGDSDYSPSQTVKNISAKIAADTGMYREGQYVDHVSTEGVIQKPKATKPAATKAADDEKEEIKTTTAAATDENGNPIEPETDEDGNPITRPTTADRPGMRPTAAETDEDGNPIELETDEDGNLIELETDEDGNLIESETDEDDDVIESETDEDGNPIESETEETSESVSAQRPGSTTSPTSPTSPTSSTRPTSSSGNGAVTRPGGNSGITSTVPGNTTPGTGSSGTTGNGAVTRPGSTTETTAGSSLTTRPGSTTETTAGSSTATRPGSIAETTAADNSSAGRYTGSAPGSSTTSNEDTITVPGGTLTTPTAAAPSVTGTVAAPGQ